MQMKILHKYEDGEEDKDEDEMEEEEEERQKRERRYWWQRAEPQEAQTQYWKNNKIKDHHPESAIIDRELWDKVQSILEEKAPTEEVKAKHSNRYWTSGKIFCGLCSERYVSLRKKQ